VRVRNVASMVKSSDWKFSRTVKQGFIYRRPSTMAVPEQRAEGAYSKYEIDSMSRLERDVRLLVSDWLAYCGCTRKICNKLGAITCSGLQHLLS